MCQFIKFLIILMVYHHVQELPVLGQPTLSDKNLRVRDVKHEMPPRLIANSTEKLSTAASSTENIGSASLAPQTVINHEDKEDFPYDYPSGTVADYDITTPKYDEQSGDDDEERLCSGIVASCLGR